MTTTTYALLMQQVTTIESTTQMLFAVNSRTGLTQRKYLPKEQSIRVLRMHITNRNWGGAKWALEVLCRESPRNEVYNLLSKLYTSVEEEIELGKRLYTPKNKQEK